MGALTQVHKVPMSVQAHPLPLDLIDELQLVRLVGEEAARFLFGDLLSDERDVRGDALPHKGLDLGQVFRGEGAAAARSRIEAGVDGRPDAQLSIGEELQDGLSHDVRRRVAHAHQPLLLGQRLQLLGHGYLPRSRRIR